MRLFLSPYFVSRKNMISTLIAKNRIFKVFKINFTCLYEVEYSSFNLMLSIVASLVTLV